MNTRTLIAVLFSLVPAAFVVADKVPDTGPDVAPRLGTLYALVLHSETYVGLEGMPVYVSAVGPRVVGKPIRVLTGKEGIAEVTGLAPGEYSAWVSYNNHTSEIASFTIDESLIGKVAIHFNPDID